MMLRTDNHVFNCVVSKSLYSAAKFSVGPIFLGSARIGLIFTRNQKATQPGQLTQTGQQTGYLIPYEVMLGSESAAGQG